MKRALFRWAFCLLIFPATNACGQDTTQIVKVANDKPASKIPDSLMQNYEVEIFQNVLKMADLAAFNYKEVLSRAKTGDIGAIKQLLDFHKTVDGIDALNHGVTCLELIPLAGDGQFATAVSLCQPKLKQLVLERLILAQGRTKKVFLRQSLTDWAPVSWAYLNGTKLEVTERKPVQEQSEPGSEINPATTVQPNSASTKKQ